MDYVGEISSETDSSAINKQRWLDVIRDHPNLAPPQPREGINPFTKKPTVFQPRPDVARVVVNQEDVGSMSWAENDSNLINVFGEPQAVIPVAHDIAKSLGGRFKAATDA